MDNKLIIIRGLPGSGKSTKAKEIVKEIDFAVHLEADMFHMIDGTYCFMTANIGDAHKWCQSQTAFWLNRGRTVIVSNTFTTIKEMEPYFELGKKYGAFIDVVEMKGDYGNIHDVPVEVLEKMKNRWEKY